MLGQRPVLLPTDDVGALLIADYAAELRPVYLFPQVSGNLVHSLAHKGRLYRLCRDLVVRR